MYVCTCKGLTQKDLWRLACPGLTRAGLSKMLGLDDERCCGRCALNVEHLLALVKNTSGKTLDRVT